MQVRSDDALIVVDVQNDFCPGGALAVPHGDQVVPAINRIAPLFDHVVTTQDWHSIDHCSFLQYGGSWPVHCVAGTPGSNLRSDLRLGSRVHAVRKGSDADAYSGFQGTDLADWLRCQHVNRVFVAGLATDYCVRATALDALANGFNVVLLEDAVRAVDVNPGDGQKALRELQSAGVSFTRTHDLAASGVPSQ